MRSPGTGATPCRRAIPTPPCPALSRVGVSGGGACGAFRLAACQVAAKTEVPTKRTSCLSAYKLRRISNFDANFVAI